MWKHAGLVVLCCTVVRFNEKTTWSAILAPSQKPLGQPARSLGGLTVAGQRGSQKLVDLLLDALARPLGLLERYGMLQRLVCP
jgi:hypothetical protein